MALCLYASAFVYMCVYPDCIAVLVSMVNLYTFYFEEHLGNGSGGQGAVEL